MSPSFDLALVRPIRGASGHVGYRPVIELGLVEGKNSG